MRTTNGILICIILILSILFIGGSISKCKGQTKSEYQRITFMDSVYSRMSSIAKHGKADSTMLYMIVDFLKLNGYIAEPVSGGGFKYLKSSMDINMEKYITVSPILDLDSSVLETNQYEKLTMTKFYSNNNVLFIPTNRLKSNWDIIQIFDETLKAFARKYVRQYDGGYPEKIAGEYALAVFNNMLLKAVFGNKYNATVNLFANKLAADYRKSDSTYIPPDFIGIQTEAIIFGTGLPESEKRTRQQLLAIQVQRAATDRAFRDELGRKIEADEKYLKYIFPK